MSEQQDIITPERIRELWDWALIEQAGTGESALLVFWRLIYGEAGQ